MSGERRRNSTTLYRPLGSTEHWWWVGDRITPFNVTARVHLCGLLTETCLGEAAQTLVSEYPALQVSIDRDTPALRPPHDPVIPVRRVIAGDAAAWQREIATVELTTPFDEGRPPARLVDIVQHSANGECHDLLLTASHIVFDARSALLVLQRFIELAAALSGETDLSTSVVRQRALPPLTDLLPAKRRGWRGGIRGMGVMAANQLLRTTFRSRTLPREAIVAAPHRRPGLLHKEFDTATLTALIQRCRREQVTVHAALVTAAASAIAELLGRRAAALSVGTAVDVRAKLEPAVGPLDTGCFVVVVPSYVHVAETQAFWEVARRYLRELHRQRRRDQDLSLAALTGMFRPKTAASGARAMTLLESAAPALMISNNGTFPFPASFGSWQLSGAQFVAGGLTSGCLLSFVNTSHDTLQWNWIYIRDAMSAETASHLADRSADILLEAL
jgi:hypothetical protein